MDLVSRPLVAVLALGLAACAADTATEPTRLPIPTPTASSAGPLVAFLGDSLTAGFGLAEEHAFPARVGWLLAARGRPIRVVNGGVSGDTTAGGLARLSWLLELEPEVVVVGLGANDGLRGHDLASSEANLRTIVVRCREAGAEVLLLGMLIPQSYGPDYTARFAAVYRTVAEQLGVALVPFLLEGVAARPELNLEDGIHPNARGHEIIADTVAAAVEPLLGD